MADAEAPDAEVGVVDKEDKVELVVPDLVPSYDSGWAPRGAHWGVEELEVVRSWRSVSVCPGRAPQCSSVADVDVPVAGVSVVGTEIIHELAIVQGELGRVGVHVPRMGAPREACQV